MHGSRRSAKKSFKFSRYLKQNISSRIFCAEPEAWQTIEIGGNWVIRLHVLATRKLLKK